MLRVETFCMKYADTWPKGGVLGLDVLDVPLVYETSWDLDHRFVLNE